MLYSRENDGEAVPALFLPTGKAAAQSRRPAEPAIDSLEAGACAALLERIRQRDGSALMEIYDRCQGAIYQFVLQMSGDAGAAADVTQEVFLMLLERCGRVGGLFSRFDPHKGGLEAYLMGVARRLTRKLQLNQSRWMPFEEDLEISASPRAGEELESRLTVGRLRFAIARLPVKYREVIVLCCLQERSYEDVAKIIGCSMGTVASRLSRARKILAARV